jgi:ABC-type Fe3+-hydroxamate transport system substrate-binding protein
MYRRSILVALLAMLLLIWACSGSKSSGTSTAKSQTTFDFGRSTTVQSLYNLVVDMLDRNTYHRTQLGTPTLIETDWRTVAPDSTEAARGISETRHKIVVSIAARRNISVATLRLTSEARYGNGPWLKSVPSPDLVKTIEVMQRQIKLELSQYIQQW